MKKSEEISNEVLKRFKLIRDDKNDNWIIDDEETGIYLTFHEGKIREEGYFFHQKKDKSMICDTRLVGDIIYLMNLFIERFHEDLI